MGGIFDFPPDNLDIWVKEKNQFAWRQHEGITVEREERRVRSTDLIFTSSTLPCVSKGCLQIAAFSTAFAHKAVLVHCWLADPGFQTRHQSANPR